LLSGDDIDSKTAIRVDVTNGQDIVDDTIDGTISVVVSDVNAAISTASDGDTILIYPGTYEEQVDLNSVDLSITLSGTDRDNCIIQFGGSTITSDDNCKFTNLSMISLDSVKNGGTSSGFDAVNKFNIIIDNCYIKGNLVDVGGSDSPQLINNDVIVMKNVICEAPHDLAFVGNKNFLFEECIFRSTGGFTGIGSCTSLGLTNLGTNLSSGIINRCQMEVIRTTVDSTNAEALNAIGSFIFNDCIFKVKGNVLATGQYTGVKISPDAKGNKSIFNGCVICVDGPDSSLYISPSTGDNTAIFTDCSYNPYKTTGIISVGLKSNNGGYGWLK